MNGLPYYKAYPRDFIEGTIGMDFELKAAYRLVLDLIYMQGGNLPDDARYISGLLGCTVKKWTSLRAKLVEMGKIEARGDHLGNNRADKELETLGKLQEKQRQNRTHPNKNNKLQSPRFDHTEPDTDTYKNDGDDTREREVSHLPADATDRERILSAIGVDPVSGLTGRGGQMLGKPSDMVVAARWLALPGMNIDRVCEVIRSVMAHKRDGAPSSFAYFDRSMQEFSGQLSLPPLEPVRSTARPTAPSMPTASEILARMRAREAQQ